MDDARAEYELAVQNAQAHFAHVMADSYSVLRDECQKAWYRYQVRVGMIEMPADSQERESDAESSSAGEVGDGDAGVRREDRFRGEDERVDREEAGAGAGVVGV